jgi:hypothetical protein
MPSGSLASAKKLNIVFDQDSPSTVVEQFMDSMAEGFLQSQLCVCVYPWPQSVTGQRRLPHVPSAVPVDDAAGHPVCPAALAPQKTPALGQLPIACTSEYTGGNA